jgi:DNA ligase (NAD+)
MGNRIQGLADRVVVLRDAYCRGSPLVADAEYDAVEDELRGLIEANPELAPDPNPLEQVGAPAVLHAPVRHSRSMLSLEKATRPEQVAAFFDRFPAQPVVVMPKLDGLSLALVYEQGGWPARSLAGTARPGTMSPSWSVRWWTGRRSGSRPRAGSRSGAKRSCCAPRSPRTTPRPRPAVDQPRNAAAGSLRAKDPATVAERRLQFFAFDLDTTTAADDTGADLEDGLRTLVYRSKSHRCTSNHVVSAGNSVRASQRRGVLLLDVSESIMLWASS